MSDTEKKQNEGASVVVRMGQGRDPRVNPCAEIPLSGGVDPKPISLDEYHLVLAYGCALAGGKGSFKMDKKLNAAGVMFTQRVGDFFPDRRGGAAMSYLLLAEPLDVNKSVMNDLMDARGRFSADAETYIKSLWGIWPWIHNMGNSEGKIEYSLSCIARILMEAKEEGYLAFAINATIIHAPKKSFAFQFDVFTGWLPQIGVVLSNCILEYDDGVSVLSALVKALEEQKEYFDADFRPDGSALFEAWHPVMKSRLEELLLKEEISKDSVTNRTVDSKTSSI